MDDQKIKALENRKIAIEQKMDKLEDMLLEDTIDKNRYHKKYLPLKLEHSQVETQLAQANNPHTRLLHKDIDNIISFSHNFANIYSSLNCIDRKTFLKALISKIWVNGKKIVAVNYTEPFQAIIDRDLVRIRSEWLPIQDLIRTLMANIDEIKSTKKN